jgi:hypothetical protein
MVEATRTLSLNKWIILLIRPPQFTTSRKISLDSHYQLVYCRRRRFLTSGVNAKNTYRCIGKREHNPHYPISSQLSTCSVRRTVILRIDTQFGGPTGKRDHLYGVHFRPFWLVAPSPKIVTRCAPLMQVLWLARSHHAVGLSSEIPSKIGWSLDFERTLAPTRSA